MEATALLPCGTVRANFNQSKVDYTLESISITIPSRYWELSIKLEAEQAGASDLSTLPTSLSGTLQGSKLDLRPLWATWDALKQQNGSCHYSDIEVARIALRNSSIAYQATIDASNAAVDAMITTLHSIPGQNITARLSFLGQQESLSSPLLVAEVTPKTPEAVPSQPVSVFWKNISRSETQPSPSSFSYQFSRENATETLKQPVGSLRTPMVVIPTTLIAQDTIRPLVPYIQLNSSTEDVAGSVSLRTRSSQPPDSTIAISSQSKETVSPKSTTVTIPLPSSAEPSSTISDNQSLEPTTSGTVTREPTNVRSRASSLPSKNSTAEAVASVNTGTVTGLALGSAAAVAGIAILGVYLWRRRKSQMRRNSHQEQIRDSEKLLPMTDRTPDQEQPRPRKRDPSPFVDRLRSPCPLARESGSHLHGDLNWREALLGTRHDLPLRPISRYSV